MMSPVAESRALVAMKTGRVIFRIGRRPYVAKGRAPRMGTGGRYRRIFTALGSMRDGAVVRSYGILSQLALYML